MQLLPVLCGFLSLALSTVSATALTYKLEANEKACFFASVDRVDAKIAFYFAVQSGGSFDVDYVVTNPSQREILSGQKEKQGDYVFTAKELGEYKFCFSNEMSTFADKMVDFEIAVEDEPKQAQIPTKGGADSAQTQQLEDTIFKVGGQLSTISRMQKYFRTRENRNFDTVKSTESRIFNFSMIEVLMMVGMAALQVSVVRFFFQGARKGYV